MSALHHNQQIQIASKEVSRKYRSRVEEEYFILWFRLVERERERRHILTTALEARRTRLLQDAVRWWSSTASERAGKKKVVERFRAASNLRELSRVAIGWKEYVKKHKMINRVGDRISSTRTSLLLRSSFSQWRETLNEYQEQKRLFSLSDTLTVKKNKEKMKDAVKAWCSFVSRSKKVHLQVRETEKAVKKSLLSRSLSQWKASFSLTNDLRTSEVAVHRLVQRKYFQVWIDIYQQTVRLRAISGAVTLFRKR